MLVRVVAFAAVFAVAGPALAEPLNAEAARRFVVGKLFSFNCFEGTTGSGRIFNDGSVAGVVRMQGNGQTRFMHLPSGTLFPQGETVCSKVKGAFFNPCFNLTKTGANSFRGAVSGFGFAYCDFQRRGGGRDMVASVAPAQSAISAAIGEKPATPRTSIRTTRKVHAAPAPSEPVAAPVKPVSAEPLASPGDTGIRPSISN